MLKLFLQNIVALVFVSSLQGVEIQTLVNALHAGPPQFSYPLDLKIYKGSTSNEGVLLCCHGFGSSSSIAEIIAAYRIVPEHLVGFNFPDYNITSRTISPEQMAYGTIDELLPAIYLLKKIAVDARADRISIYGFSAGAAAVVNLIALLNTSKNNKALEEIGVSQDNVQKILSAIQRGVILLDAPLKSMDEYNAAHPEAINNPLDALLTKRFQENGMNPIDAILKWKGLKLSVVVFFQNPDAAVSNRDDALFKQRLKEVNPNGQNMVLSGDEGGHLGFHTSLWKGYQQLLKKLNPKTPKAPKEKIKER